MNNKALTKGTDLSLVNTLENTDIELTSEGKELFNDVQDFFITNHVTRENIDDYAEDFEQFLKVLSLKKLKKYSKPLYKKYDKELINSFEINKKGWEYGVIINKIKENKLYEVYIYIQYENTVVSNLLEKSFEEKKKSTKYYKYLCRLVKWSRFKQIQKKIRKTK